MKALAPFVIAACLSGASPAGAAEPSPHAIHVPSWFAESFLDLREEQREAAANGKRVMVYFGQDGCPYCKALMEANFSQRDIVEATRRHFVAIALNLWGDRETTWTDGVMRSEKNLGEFLRVQFTPTLLFIDEEGRVALRLNGYQPPARLRLALDFASRRLERAMTFAEFVRSEPLPAARRAQPDPRLFRTTPPRLDLRGDKPLILVFESRDCDPCAELHEALNRPQSQAAMKGLEAARFDVFGAHPVTTASGAVVPEAEFARSLGVAFTPTLVFLDPDRREVFRSEGYLRPFHLASVLDYVSSGAWKMEPSFQRYIQGRAERERAAGRQVELW